jgi:hypothetical protein
MRKPKAMASTLTWSCDSSGRRESAHDDARHEGAQHDVEAEPAGEGEQRDEQEHREPQRGLRATVVPPLEDRPHTIAGQAGGQPREDHGQDGEAHQAEKGDEGRLGAQEDGDREDGAELAPGPRAHEEAAEPGAELMVVTQDRQQRAQRRRRQRDGDPETVLDDPRSLKQDGAQPGEDQGATPADRREPPALTLDGDGLELQTGEEEEHPEAELREELDRVVDLDEPEQLGPEDHPAAEQHHDLGHLDAQQAHEERDERRDRGDDEQRAELVHSASFAAWGITMRSSAVSSLGVPARAPSTANSSGFLARIVVT